MTPTNESGKFSGYGSEYIDSSDAKSYDDTSERSVVDDARRNKSKRKIYDPKFLLDDFSYILSLKILGHSR